MKAKPVRHGFTLVELLVVITIIAVISGFLVSAVFYAQKRAQTAKIASELNQIQLAFHEYKNKYSAFPPDFSNKNIVARHLRLAWPRMDPNEFTFAWNLFWVDPNNPNDHRSYVDPAEAIVFWLGGMSADSAHPFTGPGGPFHLMVEPDSEKQTRLDPLMQFNEGQLNTVPRDHDGNAGTPPIPWSTDEQQLHGQPAAANDVFPVYTPEDRAVPYVYFHHVTYGDDPDWTDGTPPTPLPPSYPPPMYVGSSRVQGVARPYRSDRPRNPTPRDSYPFQWIRPLDFQVVSAGLDDNYGENHPNSYFKRFPSGEYYYNEAANMATRVDRDGDDNNITNFSNGRPLKDNKP